MESLAALADWETFFAAQLGAAAALLGLLFVGLSINLEKILKEPSLPNRALLALALLLCTLMMSSYVMIPNQGTIALGYEVFCTAIGLSGLSAVVEWRTRRWMAGYYLSLYGSVLFLGMALVPYLIGGWLLMGGSADGLYWVAAGIVVSFVKAVVDAWVLLVEINR
jgi:modulator of FtsH protease